MKKPSAKARMLADFSRGAFVADRCNEWYRQAATAALELQFGVTIGTGAQANG